MFPTRWKIEEEMCDWILMSVVWRVVDDDYEEERKIISKAILKYTFLSRHQNTVQMEMESIVLSANLMFGSLAQLVWV
jgi:hypothetical protein